MFLNLQLQYREMNDDKLNIEEAQLPVLSRTQKQWYAVYTHPRAEKAVHKRLKSAGITSFLPLQKTLRQWSDRKKIVDRPIISSYVFVKIGRKEQQTVLNTDGVARFIKFENEPVRIPEEQIVNLKILSDSDVDITVSEDVFIKGDLVEVAYGSLAGLRGELIRVGKQHQVVMHIIDSGLCLTVDIKKSEIKKIKIPDKRKPKS